MQIYYKKTIYFNIQSSILKPKKFSLVLSLNPRTFQRLSTFCLSSRPPQLVFCVVEFRNAIQPVWLTAHRKPRRALFVLRLGKQSVCALHACLFLRSAGLLLGLSGNSISRHFYVVRARFTFCANVFGCICIRGCRRERDYTEKKSPPLLNLKCVRNNPSQTFRSGEFFTE